MRAHSHNHGGKYDKKHNKIVYVVGEPAGTPTVVEHNYASRCGPQNSPILLFVVFFLVFRPVFLLELLGCIGKCIFKWHKCSRKWNGTVGAREGKGNEGKESGILCGEGCWDQIFLLVGAYVKRRWEKSERKKKRKSNISE